MTLTIRMRIRHSSSSVDESGFGRAIIFSLTCFGEDYWVVPVVRRDASRLLVATQRRTPAGSSDDAQADFADRVALTEGLAAFLDGLPMRAILLLPLTTLTSRVPPTALTY